MPEPDRPLLAPSPVAQGRPGRGRVLLAGLAAGALSGVLVALAGFWWVSNGASVGWASFNSDGVDASLGTKLTFTGMGSATAAVLGGVIGLAVAGTALAVGGRRSGSAPETFLLAVQLTATWAVALLPLLVSGGSSSYAQEVPTWGFTAGCLGTAVWMPLRLRQAARNGRPTHPTAAARPTPRQDRPRWRDWWLDS